MKHIRMRKYRRGAPIVIALMVIHIVFGTLAFVPAGVRAADSYWVSVLPAGTNSSYFWSYGHYYSGEGPRPEALVANDSSEFDLYTTLPTVAQRTTISDFTDNSSWVWVDIEDYIDIGERTITKSIPPDLATIDSVLVVTRFGVVLPAPGTVYFPSMYLGYALDGGTTHWSSLYPPSMSTNPYIVWNVTNEETWTPDDFNDTDLEAGLITLPQQNVHYYLDYVGFIIGWHGEYVGGGEEGAPIAPDIPTDYSDFFTVANIPGIMGIVGFFGMVVSAPLGIYLAQNSEKSRIAIGIKTLAMFMVFLTFFMLSIV